MNTREHLIFFARIKGVKNVKENVALVMARLGLTPHAKTLANKLSGGNKRKLSLAIAIIGAPPVLVLDEPTSAMDAVGKRAFWKIIKSIAPDHSILLTVCPNPTKKKLSHVKKEPSTNFCPTQQTHSMEEADNLATRAAILSRRLLAVGTTQTLREKYSNVYHVNIMLTSSPGSTPEEMDKVRSFVHDSVPSAKLERDMLGGQVRFTIDAVSGKAPSSSTSSSSSPQQQQQQQQHQSGRGSNVTALITLLEENKQALGIEYYSISAATLETVFLSVVRANNVQEEDGVASQKMIHRLKRLF
jgi:ABC-type multidrug transport system ATPase subunit